jgi:parallel beta-helix repeat protein
MKRGIICILVCMLMILTTVVPVSAHAVLKTTARPLITGNILYVGGSGSNNYTKIQDAIDDSNSGYTIFVYRGTYYENLMISKSITLQGENKENTIIDGQEQGNVIFISKDHVTIRGFTLQRGGWGHYAGVWIDNVNFNKIEGNAILDNHFWGICLNGSSFNTIKNNTISLNNLGIEAGGLGFNGNTGRTSNYNIFTNNVISSNEYIGIGFGSSKRNLFYQNILSNSSIGISFWHNINNVIYKNVFIDNDVGLELQFSRQNIVLSNNFLDNQQDAYFLMDHLIQRNIFLRNYWNASSQLPFVIHGGFLALNRSFNNPFKCIQIDWLPTQEPYDIPGME